MDLACPKCRGTMHTYERNGVHVDQCTDCRGIFLDRGELDRLIDAERAWHGDTPSASSASSHQQAQGAGLGSVVGEVLQQVRGQKHAGHGQQYGHGSPRRKKESFLDGLFG
jgi:Zn-finger nucleic acid-binding protein